MACKAKWTGLQKRLEFSADVARTVPIATNPELLTCVSPNDILSIETTVALNMDDVSKTTGCNKESYLIKGVGSLCEGTDDKFIKLLTKSMALEYTAPKVNS
uniref:Uncharacterized protein n=1 Tax=Ciona savignyi TaxID=51511 RepID=H2YB43_CIOSA